jgi:hypothetical protein
MLTYIAWLVGVSRGRRRKEEGGGGRTEMEEGIKERRGERGR